MNITKIDLLIITSWDDQKVEKITQVIREFEIDEVWTSEKIPQKIYYEQISENLRQLAVVTKNPKAGQQYKFDDLIIDVYNPQEIEYDDNAEANSIVLRLGYGDFCAFLPSDLDATEPQVLSVYDDKKCPIFKMRNNGEARPQASVLFDKISPLDVIISVGQNEYGYPSSTTLQRLSIAKVGIYRTDLDGDIRVNAGYDGSYLIYTDN
jgi:beta-lactamase superfamily II metal-dependent hydrolase